MKNTIRIPITKIDLKTLSSLWIEDHEDTEPGTPLSPLRADEPVEKWKNAKIAEFYATYILPYKRSVTNPQLQIIDNILSIFENESEACSSIIDWDPDTDPRYCDLHAISLIDHTLSVAKIAHDLHKKSNNDAHVSMGLVLIAALSHDIGKYPPIGKQYGRGLLSHVYSSSEWLKNLGAGALPIEAVAYHHASDTEIKRRCKKENYILAILRYANQSAREKELKGSALQKRQSGRTITDILKKSDTAPDGSAFPKAIAPPSEVQIPVPASAPQALPGVVSADELLDFDEDYPNGDKIVIYDTYEAKERGFSEWFNEELLFEAIMPSITSNGLDAFFHEGNVYVTAKALYRIINEMRTARGMLTFERIEDARTYLSVKINRIKNAQCQIAFKKKPYRPPAKAYYYIIDAGYLKNIESADTAAAHDLQGHFIHSVRILKVIENIEEDPTEEDAAVEDGGMINAT